MFTIRTNLYTVNKCKDEGAIGEIFLLLSLLCISRSLFSFVSQDLFYQIY